MYTNFLTDRMASLYCNVLSYICVSFEWHRWHSCKIY